MATYPIKMLKDENNNPFVPLVSTECVKDPGGQSLDQKLATKLETSNILAGDNTISVSTSGNNVSITANLPAGSTLIDNTTTSTAGQGALDAHQGKVLRDSIPVIVDDVTDTSATKALSANQGYVLNQKFSDYVLTTALENLVKQYILASHPIGSIEINISGANPSTYLGGTWVAWGTGKVPVGVNTNDSDFNTVEKTGGSKTASTTYTPAGINTGGAVGNHTLTTAEIPAHTHGSKSLIGTGPHMAGDESFVSGIVSHISNTTGVIREGTYQEAGSVIHQINATHEHNSVGGSGAHNHGFTNPTFTGTQATITESTVQPYITCYMWKRTA